MKRIPLLLLLAVVLPACDRGGSDDDTVTPPGPAPVFGTAGVVQSNPSVGTDEIKAMTADATALYIVGSTIDSGNGAWRIEKRDKGTGALVTTFGGVGFVISNPSAGTDTPYAIAIDATSMYVAGSGATNGDSNLEWRVEKRDLVTGTLDGTFGGMTGAIVSDLTTSNEECFGIAIDSLGMYLAGYANPPATSANLRLEKRFLDTGNLDPAFDLDGIIDTNPSGDSDAYLGIVVSGTFLFTAGYNNVGGQARWHIEKRGTANGALDGGFGTGGIKAMDFSGLPDGSLAIAADATNIYVAGNDQIPGNGQWRIGKFLQSTGAEVTAFDTDGYVVTDFSIAIDTPRAIAVDGTAVYAAGSDNVAGNVQWRLEKYNVTTGAIIGAAYTVNPSSLTDDISSLLLDGTDLFLGGHDQVTTNSQWRIEKRAK